MKKKRSARVRAARAAVADDARRAAPLDPRRLLEKATCRLELGAGGDPREDRPSPNVASISTGRVQDRVRYRLDGASKKHVRFARRAKTSGILDGENDVWRFRAGDGEWAAARAAADASVGWLACELRHDRCAAIVARAALSRVGNLGVCVGVRGPER